jgi:broad specificity phosphatase PhoE
MKTFKLHLIRHGLTSGNLQGLYIGSGTDIPQPPTCPCATRAAPSWPS